ncbi:DUF397 domain-containing protein [Streptomyces spinosirectus]|jgi:hypothetical protein|uniref:DUF397 domain-containing protein n=1 Tax=Streptomyces TaxID=1883 RepID=UPI000D377527|nr:MULTISPECIES: DUF397 domain-containing protein [Streptomyces]MBY8339887.1 DUF397 domain-containing protein [Streptomyces plumbidurans]PTM98122.1 uncharacterized protein DUF397 [Streptomyces sp. VMFN-G11Ma]UIR19726.1 DUF397 domain-containing protein [Streptomyces spinosirectus]
MGTNPGPSGAIWRKSSYSGDTGGQCVECAPLGTATWRKASYSGGTGGDCVEVADLTAHIAIRDSKHPAGGTLTVSAGAFSSWVRAIAQGSGTGVAI